MQNVFGRFFHHCADASADAMRELFTEDAVLFLPEAGIDCVGSEAAEKAFGKIFADEHGKSKRSWHIPHNLSVKFPLSATEGQLYCETHSFRAGKDETSFVMFCTRVDAGLRYTDAGWKISKLCWYTAQVFQPICNAQSPVNIFDVAPAVITTGDCDASDHIEIQNLIGQFAIWNRNDAETLFADNSLASVRHAVFLPDKCHPCEALQRLAKLEADNQGYYLSVPYLGAPVIYANGDRAEGWWLSHTYSIQSAGDHADAGKWIVRRMERYYCTFVRENGLWKILSVDVTCIAELPGEAFDKEIHGQSQVGDGEDHWPYPFDVAENYAADYPEDIYTIQSMFPQWGLRLRRKEMQQFPDLFFIEDRDKVVIDINIRRNNGIEEIRPRLLEFDTVCRPKQTTSHNTSSPYFYMNEKGDHAYAAWFDQSWTNMNAVFGLESELVQFMLNCGLYCFEFMKEKGEWKVAEVWWRVIFRLPDLKMDFEPKCFCNTYAQELWPLPFEEMQV